MARRFSEREPLRGDKSEKLQNLYARRRSVDSAFYRDSRSNRSPRASDSHTNQPLRRRTGSVLSVKSATRGSFVLQQGDFKTGGRRGSNKLQQAWSGRQQSLAGRLLSIARRKSRQLSESFRFATLTTLLTFYALFGDDFRLAATSRSTDIAFDVTTLLCISTFFLEMVAASLGKDDYFLGFFFWLDLLSTCTLVFDLTFVSNAIFCADAEAEGGAALKTSRAGRAGARAGRTVRIIRLMRLVKLYKAYKLAMETKERRIPGVERISFFSTRGASESWAPGEDDDDASQPPDEQHQHQQQKQQQQREGPDDELAETRVGKKLGDMTTRRVIVLVLMMLFCMPQFLPATYGIHDFSTSAEMGTEFIYERFRQYCPLEGTTSQPWCLQMQLASAAANPTSSDALVGQRPFLRSLYEDFLLELVYSHLESGFSYKLAWLGMSSSWLVDAYRRQGHDEKRAMELAGESLASFAPLAQAAYLGTHRIAPSSWDAKYANGAWQTKLETLSDESKSRLQERWVENCVGSFWGVPLGIPTAGAAQCSISDELRCSEVVYYAPLWRTEEESDTANIIFAFDIRGYTRLEGSLSMVQTLFICLCVGLGAVAFSSDVNQLLLQPIERMISKMEHLEDNPLEAMRLGDQEYRREEVDSEERKAKFAHMGRCVKLFHRLFDRKIKEPMETVILEKTIIKLGGLLALGFGEAGAEIVGKHMADGGHGEIEPMLPGSRVKALLGICNIQDFLAVAEALQEQVMVFVNQVGEIVHGCVDEYNGAPNRHVGNGGFFLVWRLPEDRDQQRKLADMAVMACIRIITEVSRSPSLAVYRHHPAILSRAPDYRTQCSFGLHAGWAIEGAIGSKFKIDAAYLSPNVAVAASLDQATSAYGVSLLMSHRVAALCNEELSALSRLVDHSIVPGSKVPLRLLTFDLDCGALPMETKGPTKFLRNRFKIRQIREVWKREKWLENYCVWEAFEQDESIVAMRAKFSPEFFRRFATAYRNYEAGCWRVARDLLFTCDYAPRSNGGGRPPVSEEEWPEDGPTTSLLRFMQKTDYRAPADWRGFRHHLPMSAVRRAPLPT